MEDSVFSKLQNSISLKGLYLLEIYIYIISKGISHTYIYSHICVHLHKHKYFLIKTEKQFLIELVQ